MRVARHLRISPRGRRSPGQGITQGVIRAPYASVPITGNQIPKFQFPMLSRSPRAQISAQLCQTSSQSISQDQDISRSALCACAATSGSGLRQEAAQSCCYTSGTLFAAKDIGGKYTEGLLPSSSFYVFADYAPNVHCIWLVELARIKWLKQCPSMIAAQRMCERDRTCLIGLASRHLLRKSEIRGALC